jgi:hypothetical protein
MDALKPGLIADGVIVALRDGTVKDFVTEGLDKWDNPDQTVIEVTCECKHQNDVFRDVRLFTYKNNVQGEVVYGTQSNLGKFAAYYKKLPAVSDQVQMKTNAAGYFKLVIE